MKIWNTKYALTNGITEHEAEDCFHISEGWVKYQTDNGYLQYLHGEGKQWHRTQESALARAEEMRQKKIQSLRKQLAKIESLRFVAVGVGCK